MIPKEWKEEDSHLITAGGWHERTAQFLFNTVMELSDMRGADGVGVGEIVENIRTPISNARRVQRPTEADSMLYHGGRYFLSSVPCALSREVYSISDWARIIGKGAPALLTDRWKVAEDSARADLICLASLGYIDRDVAFGGSGGSDSYISQETFYWIFRAARHVDIADVIPIAGITLEAVALEIQHRILIWERAVMHINEMYAAWRQ